jgi:hypothetical protein
MIHLSRISMNVKTGPIPVTTSPRSTCPSTCPAKGNGCYAENFHMKMHWNKVDAGTSKSGTLFDIENLCLQVRSFPQGQLWRHNQAGDLAGKDLLIDADALYKLASANKKRKGFTYTHKPVVASPGVSAELAADNLAAVRQANELGFTVNLSANNLAEVDTYKAMGLPVVVIMPVGSSKVTYTPEGNKVVICPAQRSETLTCASCGLCQKKDRSCVVGFEVHGNQAKKLQKVLEVVN